MVRTQGSTYVTVHLVRLIPTGHMVILFHRVLRIQLAYQQQAFRVGRRVAYQHLHYLAIHLNAVCTVDTIWVLTWRVFVDAAGIPNGRKLFVVAFDAWQTRMCRQALHIRNAMQRLMQLVIRDLGEL
jgi:hypothetical protein